MVRHMEITMIKTLCRALFLILIHSSVATANCDGNAELDLVCGFTAPEDIELAPDNTTLLVGEMILGGRLMALNSDTYAVSELFPAQSVKGDVLWGEETCTDYPDQMTFHGIDLTYRADGVLQLLAVNHGERESVEFFEVLTEAEGAPKGLIWRGCAMAPGSESLNDVAALPGGGFVSTTPFEGSELWSIVKALVGFNTGYVRQWDPESGWSIIAGTEGRYPNGVIARPDGSSFFVNLYIDGLVREYTLDGTVIGEAEVLNGDNLSWGSDGRIRIASHRASSWQMVKALQVQPSEDLKIPFAIVEYDPVSQAVSDIFVHDGSTYGAATVAQEVDGKLFMGSFKGGRVAVLKAP